MLDNIIKKLNVTTLLLSLFVVTTFVMTAANAGVYKWTDKDGNIHYGDQPEVPKNSTELNISPKPSSGYSVSSDKKKERDQLLEEFKEDREARKKKRDDKRIAKKKLNKQCARARDTLRRYQEASGVYKLNSKGGRVFYSKKDRAKKERKYNKAITKHCR